MVSFKNKNLKKENPIDMNIKLVVYALVVMTFIISSCGQRSSTPKVLVFSKTAGFYHQSIPTGIEAIQKLGEENGFEVDTTKDANQFTEDNLRQYAAVIWLSTTGDVLNPAQEADFERYIQSGGGYVGVHAAADTEYEWGWYNRLAGGYFLSHPRIQEATVKVVNSSHPSTSFLPAEWKRTDEWYNYKSLYPEVNVLLELDESSYEPGEGAMGTHPHAWYHDYDGGRAFYTGGGHTEEAYAEPLFLQHLLAGIQYAIGQNKKPDFSKVTTQRVPEENRFEKITLSIGEFTEPTEITVLHNLDILIAQRRGEILWYNQTTEEITEVGKLDVYWKTDIDGVNAEEGLMGIQKDPNYESNHHVFVYYSPVGDEEINRLSRFTFDNGEWDMDSEQVILELYSQRNICCHTGGSIAFDKDGLLYLSTGDNSTPFNQPTTYKNEGFAPLDDREGFRQYDARRTSGNSNDLRGKILRIKVNEDGTYSIPSGNLYPEGTPKTRPEIYVQGNRNPYRISIDQKTGFLYWGEVGPDAANNDFDQRGPRGYDEVNQAREAGNFGWPYHIGNNYAYKEYDYATGVSGEAFDPASPKNNSENNTGLTELPPAQPAFIWYPYDESPDFPQVGTGGRNAMAGPVYYSDLYPDDPPYPSYFDGKLFIYDWIRGWIKIITMRENGDFDKMEPFMASTTFNALMDFEVGPDGKFYLLEYGKGWFSKNADAGLFRIDFNPGNRVPVIESIEVDRTSGAIPLAIQLKASATDPEMDPLTYEWHLGPEITITTDEPSLHYSLEDIGEYEITVSVSDPEGLSTQSAPISVYAGNIAPEVSIEIEGNQTFYFPGTEVAYTISVNDPDDPSVGSDLSSAIISSDYLTGVDLSEANRGHLIMADAIMGKNLLGSLTCLTCHKENEPSIGPSYTEVARKYRRSDATDYLVEKIQNGGGGVWGEVPMPANPTLSTSDAKQIVAYIQSLGRRNSSLPASLPVAGKISPTAGKEVNENGVFILNASFTDKGGDGIKPLMGNATKSLIHPVLNLKQAAQLEGYSLMNFNEMDLGIMPSQEGYFMFESIDLTGIRRIQLAGGGQMPSNQGFNIEIRLDAKDGPVIGTGTFKVAGSGEEGQPIFGGASISIEPLKDGKARDLYFVSKPLSDNEAPSAIMSIAFITK
jgi:cytochrome c